MFEKDTWGGFDILISQQGQVKKKSLLLGLCQKLILGQKCRYLAKSALFWPKMGPDGRHATGSSQKHCFLLSRHDGKFFWVRSAKKIIFGQN